MSLNIKRDDKTCIIDKDIIVLDLPSIMITDIKCVPIILSIKRPDPDPIMTGNQKYYWNEICNIVEKQGWTVISDRYINITSNMEFICSNGHKQSKLPQVIKDKRRVFGCGICSGKSSSDAQRRFAERIAKLQGTIIGDYKGTHFKIECRCIKNHACFPNVGYVLSGGGMCATCTDQSPIEAEKTFRRLIAEQKGTVVGNYINNRTSVECLCQFNHKCSPQPTNIQQGEKLCLTCCQLRKESDGANNVRQYLIDSKISFETEVRLESISKVKRSYDFLIDYKGIKCIIEFDGKQHFNRSTWHKIDGVFEYEQTKDRTKTYVALTSGYNVIRIQTEDYKSTSSFLDSTLNKITSSSTLFVDDIDKYSYLLDVEVSNEDLLKSCMVLQIKKILLRQWLYRLPFTIVLQN